MIWLITAMLVYADPQHPVYTDYLTKSFETKAECLNYVHWNMVHLVDGVYESHRFKEGEELTTFSFFCENRYVNLDEV